MNSAEVRDEGRKNRFRYVTMDTREPVGDRVASELLWSSLAETYAKGGIELHVHFRAGFVNGGIAGDWCAIFNRSEDWLDFVDSDTAEDDEGNGLGSEKGNVGQTVLVLDGKLVELPERVVGDVLLPSVVRLQPLDDCLRVWVDAPKHAVQFFEVIVATRAEHRKLGVALGTFGQAPALVCQGQLKSEVVESGAKIVKAVSDDEAEFGGGWLLKDFDPKDLLAALNLGFRPNSIRAFFAPSVQFAFKTLQVVERPV